MKTFQQYLADSCHQGAIDFQIRAEVLNSGDVAFYIHPANADGDTLDFVAKDNQLSPNPRVHQMIEFWWMDKEHRISVPLSWPKTAVAMMAAFAAGAAYGDIFELMEIDGRLELIATGLAV